MRREHSEALSTPGFPHGRLWAGAPGRAPAGVRVAIVVSRYNGRVTTPLLEGAATALVAAGVAPEAIDVAFVPGAFELPFAADRLAAAGCDAVICLGAIIKGETTHDLHIASAVATGIEAVARARGIPVVFGVLTCQSIEQAVARAGGDMGVPRHSHKGEECAAAAIEMLSMLHGLGRDAPRRRAADGGSP